MVKRRAGLNCNSSSQSFIVVWPAEVKYANVPDKYREEINEIIATGILREHTFDFEELYQVLVRVGTLVANHDIANEGNNVVHIIPEVYWKIYEYIANLLENYGDDPDGQAAPWIHK